MKFTFLHLPRFRIYKKKDERNVSSIPLNQKQRKKKKGTKLPLVVWELPLFIQASSIKKNKKF